MHRKDRKNLPLSYWQKNSLERGIWICGYPLGYKVIPCERRTKHSQRGTLILDQEEMQMVQDLYETFGNGGYSITSIMNYMTKKYPQKKFTRSNIAQILKNKFYVGIMTYRDKDYPHRYPTFITQEQFDKCKEVFEYNLKNKATHDVFPVRKVKKSKQIILSDDHNNILPLCNGDNTTEDILFKINLSPKTIVSFLNELKDVSLIYENNLGYWDKIG